jgi:hypothetical protein
METMKTVGYIMMTVSMSLIIFAVFTALFMDHPKKDPNKR